MSDAKLYLTLRRPHSSASDTMDESAEMTLGPFDLIEVDFGTSLTLVPSRNGGTGLEHIELLEGGYFPYGQYEWSQWAYWASDEPQAADEFDNKLVLHEEDYQ